MKPEVDIPVIASSELKAGSYARQLYERLKNKMGLELDAKQFLDGWRWTHRNVFEPVGQVYSRLPSQLTEIKKPYLEIRESTRLLALTAVTLFIAGASRKCTSQNYSDNQSYIKTARNVIVGFYGFGLLIAPEVYNPFMRKDLH